MQSQFSLAIVEDRMDPLKLGRVRVRVFGVHSESLTDVPTSSLPWAVPIMPATSASISGIGSSPTQYVEGSLVFVFFQDGDSKQQPIILGSIQGIPLSKLPFGFSDTSVTDTGGISSTKVEQNVTDSSGEPVVDSSGIPIATESQLDESSDFVNTEAGVAKYGPNVNLVYKAIVDAGIKDPYAIVAILSNVGKESSFKLIRESMNYSSVDRLKLIFPSKFSTMSDNNAKQYVNNEVKLANYVYANRYGNGNEESGDGFKYRGGGFVQVTFKSNYQRVGSGIGVDLASDSNSINDPTIAAKAVAQFYIMSYGGANKLKFNSINDALESVTRKTNAGGYSRDIIKVKDIAPLFIAKIDVKAEEEKKKAESPNNPENSLDKTVTQQEINSGKLLQSNTGVGFSDPNKKYPIDSMLREPDTNRLSRRSTANTLVDVKIKNNRSGIRSIDSTFSEPKPPFNGQYPYNHVFATESGHTLEFDDTFGSERINIFHSSGTYSEIDKYGNQVNKIMGDSFTITERNGYIYVDGTARITVGSDVKLVVGGNLDIEVDGDVNYNVGGNVNWKVGGSISSNSGGSFGIDANQIHLNSNTVKSLGFDSRGANSVDYTIRTPENFVGVSTVEIDDDEPSVVDQYHKQEIEAGNMTQRELDNGVKAAETPEIIDTETPKNIDPIPASCSIFENLKDIPDNMQISKNFTIGMLSTKTTLNNPTHKLADQRNLKVSEIACNLKKVAENCGDPIKAKYPNMFVTSGFRRGSGTSQHELGQAIDMQFSGVSKEDYFTIAQWIRDNIIFDKLLLEYKTTGTGNPWIHIAYKDGPRKEIYTYMNNKNVGVGLRKLQ
jgi:putative chitinase